MAPVVTTQDAIVPNANARTRACPAAHSVQCDVRIASVSGLRLLLKPFGNPYFDYGLAGDAEVSCFTVK